VSTELIIPPADAELAELAERAFHVWVISKGDVDAVARVCASTPARVEKMARANRWEIRLRELAGAGVVSEIDKEDFETAQVVLNRGVSYVQAHRLRELCGKVLAALQAEANALDQFRVPTDGGESRLDLKALSDLARTMQVAHQLAANALGDAWAAGVRPAGRPRGGGKASVSVSSIMDAVVVSGPSRALPFGDPMDGG
jgi:hypothetical protein